MMKAVKSGSVICLAILAGWAGAGAEDDEDPQRWQGYAEGEYVWIGLPEAGRLDQLLVFRGDRVAIGADLFGLEAEREVAGVARASAELAAARSELQDLTKGLRPSEVEAIEERIRQAEAAHELARLNLQRQNDLAGTGAASIERRDAARALFYRTAAEVAEFKAELITAGLGGREDRVETARQGIASAEAALVEAQWWLDQRFATAPAAGMVFDTFFRPGEFVKAGTPVVSLLPAENIKVRFFVGEAELSGIHIGDKVMIGCDGCGAAIAAVIRYVSPEAEYTPPVIYSEQTRQSLVFMVEAWPEDSKHPLKPGQPVDVRRGN